MNESKEPNAVSTAIAPGSGTAEIDPGEPTSPLDAVIAPLTPATLSVGVPSRLSCVKSNELTPVFAGNSTKSIRLKLAPATFGSVSNREISSPLVPERPEKVSFPVKSSYVST